LQFIIVVKQIVAITFVLFVQMVNANEYSEVGLPVSQIFGLKEHGGSNQNWTLSQADSGRIYVGTGTGITEWDGEQWQKYSTPNNTRVRSISVWQDGGLYVGTIDDLGVYLPDSLGRLTYRSLVESWPAEQCQFGEIWSTATNKHGVVFLTNNKLYFWDGKQVHIVPNAPGGKHRIFAYDNGFIFKTVNDQFLYKIEIDSSGTTPIFKLEKAGMELPEDAYVRSIFYNNQGILTLVTSKNGIFQQIANKMVQKVSAQVFGSDVFLYNGIQASDGYYYLVSPNGALFILDSSLRLVAHYLQQHNLGGNTFYAVLEDNRGSIWLAGTPNIIKMIPPHRYSTFKPGELSTIIDRLVSINGQMIATGDGLFQLKRGGSSIVPAKFKRLIPSKKINFDALQYQNQLLYAGSGGVFARPINDPGQPFKNIIATAWARALKIDPVTGTLFASTYEGLFHIELIAGQWSSRIIANTIDELEFVAIEDNGVVWAGTSSQELYRVENAQFTERQNKVEKFVGADGLGPGNVMPFKLASGVVVATSDGMMDYQQGRTPALQFMRGFPALFSTPGEDVFRLHEDSAGRIWYRIGQASGYIKQNENGEWLKHSNLFDPFAGNGLKDFASMSDDTIWFAQSSGQVYRADIDLAEKPPPRGTLSIRQVVNSENKAILYGGSFTQARLSQFDQSNNSIRIHYALSGSSILKPTLYRHRLVNSAHAAWSEWDLETQKDYTLLPGGDFQFELQAQDEWGRVYNSQLVFAVSPVWYLSAWAWAFYVLLLIILLSISGWATQRLRTRKLQQQNLTLENTVAERTLEIKSKVDELEQQRVLKERFFANVTHEFRTPLTLTIAPLQELLKEHPKLEQALALPVETALRNAKNMLDLVGHILDINRLNVGQFPLHIAQYNLSDLINQLASRFEGWATQLQQSLTVCNAAEPVMLYYDRDQLDKCISNLLSNAIKYSGQQSHISLGIVNDDEQVGIEVIDNGAGIALEFQSKVFERYYQGKSSEQVSQPGTGIGLALVKDLIALHHGRVELHSQPGQGCRFILWLQRGHTHFEPSQLLENISRAPVETLATELPQKLTPAARENALTEQNERDEQDITTVLVVDDNIELRQYIALRLSGYYRIVQACDGEEGLAKAIALLPDLIISDVMMPKMDGMAMLSQLRQHNHISSIPVILLSAKSAKRDTVEGLQGGADDYLSKPFDTSELIARVDALLRSRKLIRNQLAAELAIASPVTNNSPSFSHKMRTEIVAHLTDPTFSIEQLALSLAMSRRTLNRKCREDCQQSVGQFITDIRMQIALTLLKENKLNISEVAYGTGYESLSYFSRTFKKIYGQAPISIAQ
jgi:signal transduction histidine kinase/DNA-binding response OmpR family regulator